MTDSIQLIPEEIMNDPSVVVYTIKDEATNSIVFQAHREATPQDNFAIYDNHYNLVEKAHFYGKWTNTTAEAQELERKMKAAKSSGKTSKISKPIINDNEELLKALELLNKLTGGDSNE